MKKLFLIAAMAVLSLGASAQNLKLAHVDFQDIVVSHPDYEAAMDTFAAAQKEAQETLQGMQDEYQTKGQAYEKNAATWSATIREAKEKELGDIQNRIQEFYQSVQQELQQQQQQLMEPITTKVQDAINAVAKQDGYTYVFEKANIVYVDEANSNDITAEVRKYLNIPDDRTPESVNAALQAKAQAAQAQ